MKKEFGMKKVIIIICAIVLGIASFMILADWAGDPQLHKNTVKILEDKKDITNKVAEFTTVSSITVAAIPSDATMPVANQIANLSSYAIIIMGVIMFEIFMASYLWFAFFKFFLPLSCLLIILYAILQNKRCLSIAIKLFIFGLTLAAVLPVSTMVMKRIDSHFEFEKSVLEMEHMNNLEDISSEKAEKKAKKEKKGFFDKVLDFTSDVKDAVASTSEEMLENVNYKLHSIGNILSALIVTVFITPLAVMILFGIILIILFKSLDERKKV